MTEIAARLARPILRLERRWPLVALAALVLVAGLAVLVRAYTVRTAVLPGVSVGGVDVGGLSRQDAEARIAAGLAPRFGAPVAVVVGEHRFRVRPEDLLTLDAAASAEAAYDTERTSFLRRLGAMAAPFLVGREVDPVTRLRPDGESALASSLARLTKPAVSATIAMHGLRPVIRPSQVGTEIDETALARAIEETALAGGSVLHADLVPIRPVITTSEARRAALRAKVVAAAPVAIAYRGKRVGMLSRAELARLIRFQPSSHGYDVLLAPGALGRIAAPFVASKTHASVDASFAVSGARAHVVPSRNGTQLALPAAQDAVLAAALGPGTRTAKVILAHKTAGFTTEDARALGIRRQLVSYTTEMGASSANRIHNVHLMADYIDGTVIKPGATFSFNRVVGPRTVERGFLEGQMIVGSLLLPAIGGGVCQTATTLFNDAFEAGLPIVQRTNHSWYLSHYPLGRDATVSWGGPDLAFRNDLKHGILIKTSYTDATLTFTFYGSPQGRKVVSHTGPETNFRAPAMSYVVDPTAPPHSVRVVSGTQESGFDVSVSRTVYEHGKVLRKDSFTSHYVAVGPTTIYGPGRTPPGPYVTIAGASGGT